MDAINSIFWTKNAVQQRNYVFDYWNKRNGSLNYSKKLNSAIKERITLLKNNSKLGKKSNFKDIRVISLKHYSILYKIDNSKIIITGFWDNRQSAKKLLNFLIKN